MSEPISESSTSRAGSRVKVWVLTGLKIAVSAGLIGFILSSLDVEAAFEKLTDVSPVALLVACLLIFCQLVVISYRWKVVVRIFGLDLPAKTAVRLNLEGAFFNMGLPSVIGGDAIRVYRLRRYGLKTTQSAASVLLDRGYGMIGLLVLSVVGLPVSLEYVTDPVARAGLFLIIGGGFGGFAVFLMLDFLPAGWRNWRIVSSLASLSGAARLVLRRPKLAFRIIPLSILGQALTVGVVFTIARGLDIPITYLECLAIVPIVFLISIAPVTIGGWGLREQAMVTGFSFLNISSADAFATSLLFGFCMMAVSLPGGVLWLLSTREPETAAIEGVREGLES